ncbi:MAG: RecX family transcriptional regulator [Candidatus Saccharibacteria bacterium]|nr:RecX family transcriptional regulator [Candidatus Saccharibacteria bacterium]
MDILQNSLEAPESEPSIPLHIASLKTEGNEPKKLVITRISQAVKNPNRANIFVNEKYSFSLDLSQVVDYKIRTGMSLTEREIEDFQHISEFGKLYQRTLEWTLAKPHSRKEVYDYLKRKQQKRSFDNLQIQRNREQKQDDEYFGRKSYHPHSDFRSQNSSYKEDNRPRSQSFRQRTKPLPEIRDEDITGVLKRLDEHGYLDDKKFAEFFIENRNANKGVSMKVLKMELKSKGVDENIISTAIDNSDRNDDEEMQKIIEKKRGKYDDRKLLAYLVRKGFSYDMAKSAIESMNND